MNFPRQAEVEPYLPGLLLVLAAALGGLRTAPLTLLFGAVFLAWFLRSGRPLIARGRECALLFFCWLGAASLFSYDINLSLPALARYGVFAVLVFSARREDGRGWLHGVMGLGLAAALFFIGQKALGLRVTGFIGANPNYSAIFAAAAFPAALLFGLAAAGRRRALFFALAGLLAAGILASGSRGALAAAFIAGAAGLWLSNSRRAFWLFLLSAAGAAALLPASWLEGLLKFYDPRAFARPHLWGAALDAAAASPLLGWGPGLFEKVFEIFKFPYFDGITYYGHSTLHAHGELFNLAAEAGFPAALLFAAAAAYAVFQGGRRDLALRLVLLAALLQGAVDMVFYSGAVSLLFWGTLGILSAGEPEPASGMRAERLLLAGAILTGLSSPFFLPFFPDKQTRGDYPEAAAAQVRLAALRSPRSPVPAAEEGNILLGAGDNAGAAAAYGRALALEPNFARARLGLAVAHGRAGRAADACEELGLARRSSALKAGTIYQRTVVFLDEKEAVRLENKLCGKKKTGGPTAPGRKTR